MPSRKQRRRREKSFRHEYETVLLDEEGNEVPLDEDELRAEREEREKQRGQAKTTKGKAAPTKGKRPLREPPLPTWRRALKRGGLMGAIIFIAFVFILKGGDPTTRAVIALAYGIAFIPLTYWVDRLAYRSYQKRLARSQQPPAPKKKA